MAISKMSICHTLKKINKLAPKMRKMSDQELQNQTKLLQEQLKAGKTVDQILPEAFATMREADYRVLGMFPYDVQVMGAIVLNSGSIAEMKTGEGKTLTATMALYLNALSGKGVMLVTTSDYLSERDRKELEPVYKWMGLTVSNAFPTEEYERIKITPAIKRKWYGADIVYTTASSLAFDYLFNNLASNVEGQYLRPFNYVVVDEVDEVLLDEAEMPFVVSSSPNLQSNLYYLTDAFVKLLVVNEDYRFKSDEKIFWLTYQGVKKAQQYFRIKNLFAPENRELYRHIILALSAHLTMDNGHDYLVIQGKVVLLDEADGRLKKGIQIGSGLHQALQAKENVALTSMQKTAASITFPALFSLFKKVSGMSGTAKVAEDEFLNTYGMKVIQIPTRKPVIRKDYPMKVFLTTADKLMTAINQVVEIHQTGRPILLVAGSVENSEIISELLLNEGIAHNVLNAFNAAHEAEIVKNAGQKGAVTIATNMAGRGTDIKLGKGVKELGGLAVIGTEMLSPRVKLQLAGRAGRQGDPGTSQFYVSLEDSYISGSSTTRQKRLYRRLMRKKKRGKDITELHSPITRVSLRMLQNRVASKGETARMQTNKFEQALNTQTKKFYDVRHKIMNSDDLQPVVEKIIRKALDIYIAQNSKWSQRKLQDLINNFLTYDVVEVPRDLRNKEEIKGFLKGPAYKTLKNKAQTLINKEQLNMYYQQVILTSMDKCWIDQVDYMNKLRTYTSGWANSGRDPDYVYQSTAYNSFKEFWDKVKLDCVERMMFSEIHINKKGQLVVMFN